MVLAQGAVDTRSEGHIRWWCQWPLTQIPGDDATFRGAIAAAPEYLLASADTLSQQDVAWLLQEAQSWVRNAVELDQRTQSAGMLYPGHHVA